MRSKETSHPINYLILRNTIGYDQTNFLVFDSIMQDAANLIPPDSLRQTSIFRSSSVTMLPNNHPSSSPRSFTGHLQNCSRKSRCLSFIFR